MSDLPLKGKVALVTGSSRSIGAAIAKRLAADGAYVVVNYNTNVAAADAVVQEIRSSTPGKAVAVQADMSSVADAEYLIEETLNHFGRIDILVLNAAKGETGLLNEIDEKLYEDHFNANVKTPLFMVQNVSRHMKPGMLCFGLLPAWHPY